MPGDQLGVELRRTDRLASTIAGVVEAGGTEDNQVFVSLPVAQMLAGLSGQIELVQLSVHGTTSIVAGYAARLVKVLPGYDVGRSVKSPTPKGSC